MITEEQLVKMKSRENLFKRASASALRNRADYAKWQTGDGGRIVLWGVIT